MKARVKCKLCGNQIDYSKSNIPKQYCSRSCASKSKASENMSIIHKLNYTRRKDDTTNRKQRKLGFIPNR